MSSRPARSPRTDLARHGSSLRHSRSGVRANTVPTVTRRPITNRFASSVVYLGLTIGMLLIAASIDVSLRSDGSFSLVGVKVAMPTLVAHFTVIPVLLLLVLAVLTVLDARAELSPWAAVRIVCWFVVGINLLLSKTFTSTSSSFGSRADLLGDRLAERIWMPTSVCAPLFCYITGAIIIRWWQEQHSSQGLMWRSRLAAGVAPATVLAATAMVIYLADHHAVGFDPRM